MSCISHSLVSSNEYKIPAFYQSAALHRAPPEVTPLISNEYQNDRESARPQHRGVGHARFDRPCAGPARAQRGVPAREAGADADHGRRRSVAEHPACKRIEFELTKLLEPVAGIAARRAV